MVPVTSVTSGSSQWSSCSGSVSVETQRKRYIDMDCPLPPSANPPPPSQGGPTNRSCHKMCFDSISQRLYLLGRYLSPSSRSLLQEDGAESHPLPVGVANTHWLTHWHTLSVSRGTSTATLFPTTHGNCSPPTLRLREDHTYSMTTKWP